MEQPAQWQSYLPLVFLAAVFLWRARSMNREVRMHQGRLLVAPVLVVVTGIYILANVGLDAPGAEICIAGIVAGGLLGWQRARLVTIAYDAANDTFTMKQSPFALILLFAVIVLRRVVLHSTMDGDPTSAAALPQTLWTIDGLIGFGVATVTARNGELWLRARALRAAANL